MPGEFKVKDMHISDQPQVQKWVWRNRIPADRVTMLSGDWGAGKTHTLASVITHVFQKEEFPDGEIPEIMPGHVVFLTTETDEEELVSMFLAQGMEPSDIEDYIHIIDFLIDDGGNKVVFNLDRDLAALEKVFKDYKPVILVVDPLVEFHSRKEIDTHQIRGLMVMLNQLCVKWHVTLIGMIHWNKDEKLGRKNRMSGSAQYGAGVKSVITVYRDDKDKTMRHFEQTKMTIGPEPSELGFTIEPPAGYVNWHKVEGVEAVGKVAEAAAWLKEVTADGPKLISYLVATGQFSERTLRRARSQLGHELLTVELYVDGRSQSHWDLSCERNNWGVGKITVAAPKG